MRIQLREVLIVELHCGALRSVLAFEWRQNSKAAQSGLCVPYTLNDSKRIEIERRIAKPNTEAA